jgi:hypothetical protein
MLFLTTRLCLWKKYSNISIKKMLETNTLRLGQFLKIAPNLMKYMWQKLKPEKPNIATKIISKPNVTIVIETL